MNKCAACLPAAVDLAMPAACYLQHKKDEMENQGQEGQSLEPGFESL